MTNERDALLVGRLSEQDIRLLAKEIGADENIHIDGEAFAEEWCKLLAAVVEKQGCFPVLCAYPEKVAGWCHSIRVAAKGHMRLEFKRIRAELSAIDYDDGWAVDRSGSAIEYICLAMQLDTRWLAHAGKHIWSFATGSGSYNEVVKFSQDAWLRSIFDDAARRAIARAAIAPTGDA